MQKMSKYQRDWVQILALMLDRYDNEGLYLIFLSFSFLTCNIELLGELKKQYIRAT